MLTYIFEIFPWLLQIVLVNLQITLPKRWLSLKCLPRESGSYCRLKLKARVRQPAKSWWVPRYDFGRGFSENSLRGSEIPSEGVEKSVWRGKWPAIDWKSCELTFCKFWASNSKYKVSSQIFQTGGGTLEFPPPSWAGLRILALRVLLSKLRAKIRNTCKIAPQAE